MIKQLIEFKQTIDDVWDLMVVMNSQLATSPSCVFLKNTTVESYRLNFY